MSTYRRDRANYTFEIKRIDRRWHVIITDNTNGNTWTSGGYAYRDSALGAAQKKFAEMQSASFEYKQF